MNNFGNALFGHNCACHVKEDQVCRHMVDPIYSYIAISHRYSDCSIEPLLSLLRVQTCSKAHTSLKGQVQMTRVFRADRPLWVLSYVIGNQLAEITEETYTTRTIISCTPAKDSACLLRTIGSTRTGSEKRAQ